MFPRKRKAPVSDIPRVPFYKDEKILGTKRVTVSISLRVFLASVIIFVVAIGWTLFYLIDSVNNVESYIHSAHANRVADQIVADNKVNQLGCYILANAPDDPKFPLIKKARKQYHCPPYGKDPNFVDPKKLAPPKAPAKSSTTTTNRPGSGGSSGNQSTVSQGPHPTPAPSAPGSHPTPSGQPPHPTSTPGTPSKIVAPPIVAVNEKTCSVSVVGVCLVK